MGGEERTKSPERRGGRHRNGRSAAEDRATVLNRPIRALRARGCRPPVRGYADAPPTAPTGAFQKDRPARRAGSLQGGLVVYVDPLQDGVAVRSAAHANRWRVFTKRVYLRRTDASCFVLRQGSQPPGRDADSGSVHKSPARARRGRRPFSSKALMNHFNHRRIINIGCPFQQRLAQRHCRHPVHGEPIQRQAPIGLEPGH